MILPKFGSTVYWKIVLLSLSTSQKALVSTLAYFFFLLWALNKPITFLLSWYRLFEELRGVHLSCVSYPATHADNEFIYCLKTMFAGGEPLKDVHTVRTCKTIYATI